MSKLSIISANELDYDEYVDVQKDAFSSHLKKYDVSTDFINRKLFEWKYAAPAGYAKMAIAHEGPSMVAVVATIPLWAGNSKHRALLWRAVDIATRPAGRGKGLFYKLLNAILDDMSEGEIFAAFPNSNSTPGFKKIGCADSQYAATWVRPVTPGRRKYDTETRIERFENEDAEVLRQLLVSDENCSFIRDIDYLNWRYATHPNHDYHIHYLQAEDGQCGFIIFRESEIYQRKILLVLELWSSNRSIRSELLKVASQYSRSRRIRIMLTVNSSMTSLTALRDGFIAVPRSVVPKQQVLRGLARGDQASQLLRGRWNIQMGDLLEF